jgi:hypothetical protein
VLTVKRDPGKARAGTKTTRYLIDPRIIELHPRGLSVSEVTGLYVFPEALVLEILASLNWVDGPFALHGKTKKLKRTNQDGACWRVHVILLAA